MVCPEPLDRVRVLDDALGGGGVAARATNDG